MKFSLLHEDSSLTLYKGTSEWAGLENWPTHEVGSQGQRIPGFLSNWHVGRVYSEPELTGSPDSAGMIAEFQIDPRIIEDRTKQFMEWCDTHNNPSYDISISYPKEWREDGSIWTVCDSGSGHAGVSCFNDASFVYCGISMPYTVAAFYNNQKEWELEN